MDRASLRALSHDDLISLILAQAKAIAQQADQIAELVVLAESQSVIISSRVATITRLQKRVAALEGKLTKPPKTPKTPKNSLLPPSTGKKPNLP